MADRTFTSFVQLEQILNSAITKALKNATDRLLNVLQQYVMEDFYNKYEPVIYQRTMQFYDSAKSQLLSPTSSEIYMDADSMHYNDYWDGETQLYMADAGFHGSAYIWREGFFWKDFIAYCDKNAVNILREELAKVGIKTTK